MKNKKSILSVLLIILLIGCLFFSCVACGRSTNNESTVPKNEDASKSDTSEKDPDNNGEEQTDPTGNSENEDDPSENNEEEQNTPQDFSVVFYEEDGTTEHTSITVKENETFQFPEDLVVGERYGSRKGKFLGWGVFNGDSFEETPYDLSAEGANIVTKSLKFKALYGDYQYTPVCP